MVQRRSASEEGGATEGFVKVDCFMRPASASAGLASSAVIVARNPSVSIVEYGDGAVC